MLNADHRTDDRQPASLPSAHTKAEQVEVGERARLVTPAVHHHHALTSHLDYGSPMSAPAGKAYRHSQLAPLPRTHSHSSRWME
jgi:hypothetical protein